MTFFNKFDENTLEKSDPDVISNFICFHNAFVSCGELVQCEAQVSHEIDFDDFISTVVYPYHEARSFIVCGYEDPILYRGGVEKPMVPILDMSGFSTQPTLVVHSNTNEYIPDHTESTSNT
ncbi:unnamed protein product [Schistosoma mattheei]|uniref:Uncharacterized protein n=1 Tax=Schistosoma mattheei TaxID=31246 RepID=A0A183NK18_9TREM|nr:unnamed protein product [Schistosoma mattheei]